MVCPRLLVLSSRAPYRQSVHQVVGDHVQVISYDYNTATLQDVSRLVARRVGDNLVSSLALLLHCDNTRMFITSQGNSVVSLGSLRNDSSVQDFLKELASHLEPDGDDDGGVHVFNTPPGLDTRSFTQMMTSLLDCPVEMVTELFGPLSQQRITELYFNVAQLKILLQNGGMMPVSLEGYERVKTVGKGAFGTAVLYRKLATDDLVVIKETNMLDLTTSERQMALNEVQVLSSLHHPNIIRYLGSYEIDGVLMIEMEYADGGTLSQLVAQTSRLGEREILAMFLQCVAAIKYMHQNNILHRDLKTANVFLTKDKLIKVGDFGISKMMSTKGQAQTVLGTPYYISPEICEGKQYDHKSDVWALGCILYEMACLHKTFQGNNLPVLVNKIMKGTFEPVPDTYSKGLRDLVTDILQKDPTLRPTAVVIHERVKVLLKQAEHTTNNTTAQTSMRSVLYQTSGRGATFSCVPIELPSNIRIAQVAVSNTHFIAVSSDRMVFTWGEGRRGQLGHPEESLWLSQPTLVQALVDWSVCAVAAGDGFSVFLSNSGVVLTCGDDTFGCLGHGERVNTSGLQPVEKLMDIEVKQVACGEHHCAALTRDGAVYTWGRGDSGRLGLGHQHDSSEPVEVSLALKGNNAVNSIHCGPDSTAVITGSGRVYVCGRNTHEKLGLLPTFIERYLWKTGPVESVLTLQEVTALSSWGIVSMSMAASHSVALTECGRVITMGSNDEAQLGHNASTPHVVSSVQHIVAQDAVCGPTYTVMTSVHNILYFWGTLYQAPEGNATSSVLQTQVVRVPEEMLALYASPTQIARGQTLTPSKVIPLLDTILVLVDTSVPLCVADSVPEEEGPSVSGQPECDSIGPIPEWIAAELAEAREQWDEQLFESQT